jgi:hypothetical protein
MADSDNSISVPTVTWQALFLFAAHRPRGDSRSTFLSQIPIFVAALSEASVRLIYFCRLPERRCPDVAACSPTPASGSPRSGAC